MTPASSQAYSSTGLEQPQEPKRHRRGRFLLAAALVAVIGMSVARKRHQLRRVQEEKDGA